MSTELSKQAQALIAGATALVAATATVAFAVSSGWPPSAPASAQTGTHGAPHDETDQKVDSTTIELATSDFPVTSEGLTYGSDSLADSYKEAPDLIGVVGDSGVAGFVLKKDLYGPTFASPEEALAWQEEMLANGGEKLTVYDLEGNAVDTFVLVPGEVSTRDMELP